MKKVTIVLAIAVFTVAGGCYQRGAIAANNSTDGYIPPSAEELAPMRPEYLAELAKIIEPPEMAKKPMQVRKPAPAAAIRAMTVLRSLDAPEKATHEQRAAAINDLLALAKNKDLNDSIGRTNLYSTLAMLACIDGADPQIVIGYMNNAIGDEDALALRARMYQKAGKPSDALADLEKIMVDRNQHALTGGDVDPRKASAACGWSIADFDALGADPRALAAKGFYLSSFLAFGAGTKGTVNEAEIRDLYARSSKSWRSPIPHFLVSSLHGLGSDHFKSRASCIRINVGHRVPEIVDKGNFAGAFRGRFPLNRWLLTANLPSLQTRQICLLVA